VRSHELILGGQRSGKSRCAEGRAATWLAGQGRSAVLIATAQPGDLEMRARIERHRLDRSRTLPAMRTVEAPIDLAGALGAHDDADGLVIVDCLTLWLTNLLMPAAGPRVSDAELSDRSVALCDALRHARGPVVLVSNEVGLGITPMTKEARLFIDELGRLHQRIAAICASVTLMVAGLEVPVKQPPPPTVS